MDCARKGGTAPCVMSAANEVAVHMFLRHELGYNQIFDAALAAVENIPAVYTDDLNEIIAADTEARKFVNANYGSNK